MGNCKMLKKVEEETRESFYVFVKSKIYNFKL